MTELTSIAIGGVSYQIALPDKDTDYIQGKIAKEGAPYETDMLKDMASRLKRRDLVLDVGANIGNHTLYLASVVGCRVLAFEPNAHLCQALEESIEANALTARVKLYCVGVGSSSGKAQFSHLDQANLGAQSIKLTNNEHAEIDVIRLDDLQWEDTVHAIKIDVEGMELAVLSGSDNLISRDKPDLYVECQSEEEFNKIHEWVSQRGYTYWDTFNATPTHLFSCKDDVEISQYYPRKIINALRSSYQDKEKLKDLKNKLYQANKKYRVACQKIRSLDERCNDLGKKHFDSKKKSAELEEELTSLRSSYEVLSDKYHNVSEELQDARHQILLVKASKAYKAGLYLRAATTSIDGAVKLPVRLIRLNISKEKRRAPKIKKNHFRIRSIQNYLIDKIKNISLRYGFYSQLAQVKKKYDGVMLKRIISQKKNIAKVKKGHAFDEWNKCELSSKSTSLDPISYCPKNDRLVEDLNIACVLDEFTYECLSHEVNLIKITQENWRDEIKNSDIDFLLVESCWKGNDNNWGTLTKGSGGGKKLSALLKYCRSEGIPTVFWNKEDPPHYEKFGPISALFDVAITTDINMVPKYKEDFGIEAYPLSFGAQPKIHNPIPVISRLPKAVFAGSYYSDKPKRCADFNHVMGQLEKAGIDYDIYDRNFNSDIEKFLFPANYHKHIIGKLPADEVWKAHKGYKYQVNMNSVQDSATMFARRVYESLASGTPVISNYSLGVDQLFGDVVVMSGGSQEIADRLRYLEDNPGEYDALAKQGVRKVMRDHTYGHRIKEICELLGLKVEVSAPQAVMVVEALSEKDIEHAKVMFQKQTAKNKHLFVEMHNFDSAYKYLNESSDIITFAMKLSKEFYSEERQYYGTDNFFKFSLTKPVEAESLEDSLYWG